MLSKFFTLKPKDGIFEENLHDQIDMTEKFTMSNGNIRTCLKLIIGLMKMIWV